MFEALIEKGFQVEFHSHARAILAADFPGAAEELESALLEATIPIEEIIAGGGGEAKGTQRLRNALTALAWPKTEFVVERSVNGVKRESQSHIVGGMSGPKVVRIVTREEIIAQCQSHLAQLDVAIARWRRDVEQLGARLRARMSGPGSS